MERDESQAKDLASVVARLAEMVEKLAERVGEVCTCAEPVDLPRVWKEELSKAKLALAKPLTEEQLVEDYPLSQREIAAVVERAQEKKVKPPLEAEQLHALVLEHLGDNALKDRKAALQQAMMAPMGRGCGHPAFGCYWPYWQQLICKVRPFELPCRCGPSSGFRYERVCTPSTDFYRELPTCWTRHDERCMIYQHDCRWIHDCGSPFRCGPPHTCGLPYTCPPSFGRVCDVRFEDRCGSFMIHEPCGGFMINQPCTGSGFFDPCGGAFDPPMGPDWRWDPEEWMRQNIARVRQRR